jgi:CMP-N-acetylneuraminic acid synthetase
MISPFCPELEQTKRRQDNLPAYFPYGVGYIAKTDVYLSGGTFYTERCLGYLISRFQCYEIDDKFDFDCVESMLKYLLD